ncbi:MAG: SpoIIIAH-like family protein [Clostridiales bacterium]|nr:SpoIIIAH-like family protein [Clostridiales bacterium]
MSKRKKIIIMSSLVFLLALTAVLNVLLAGNVIAKGDTAVVTTSNYFTTFRTERQTTRSEELMQLDSVIALYEEGSDRYNEAVEMKLRIVEMMENELLLETLIKSRGFSDAVVSIGMESDNVNVFINSSELNLNTALSIFSILKDEVGVAPGSIIILPIYSQV